MGEQRQRSTEVIFLGAGPGDPALLTVRAVQVLASAGQVLVDDDVDLELLCAHLRDGAPVRRVAPGAGREALSAALADGEPRPVVRVIGGDAATSPRLVGEELACRAAEASFEVVPGVGLAPAVTCYAGVPWRMPDGCQPVVVDLDVDDVGAVPWAADGGPVVLTGMLDDALAALADLLEAGRDGSELVVLTAAGTTWGQTSMTVPLARVRTAAVRDGLARGLGAGSVVVAMGPGVDLREEVGWFEGRPLFGWRVLVPEALGSGDLVDRLHELGARTETVQTVTVAPSRTPQRMERAVRDLLLGADRWVAFTCAGAVEAVRERVEGLGLDARALAGLRVASVAGEAARALRDWGIEPDLLPATPGVRALLDVFPERDESIDPLDGVLLPRAEISTETLSAGLVELGWRVDEVTAFRVLRADPPAQELRTAIKRGGFDAAVFTSAACVRNTVGIAGKPHARTVVVCIGPSTATAAQELGLRVDLVAERPTVAAVVEALTAYAAEHPAGHRAVAGGRATPGSPVTGRTRRRAEYQPADLSRTP